jgi:Na+-transporting methylmalonyl-CoA/oxaloacetate decarboxylase beta subunit
MGEIFNNLYEMTAISNLIADPSYLIMYTIAFVLLYLGIVKHYEPLLLIPIAFGVLIAIYLKVRKTNWFKKGLCIDILTSVLYLPGFFSVFSYVYESLF